MVGFSGIFRYWLGRRSLDDKRQIARWNSIVSRFKGKLVKMIKDVDGIILFHLKLEKFYWIQAIN